MMRTLPMAGLIVLSLAYDARAAPMHDPCRGAANDETMRACRQAQFDASEQRLRETYEKLHANDMQSQPKRAELLAVVQAAWRAFRDVECRLQNYDSASGTAYDLYLLVCLTQLNDARASQLQAMIEQP